MFLIAHVLTKLFKLLSGIKVRATLLYRYAYVKHIIIMSTHKSYMEAINLKFNKQNIICQHQESIKMKIDR